MAKITLQGNPIHTVGNLPEIGSTAPDFTLTKTDLAEISLQDLHRHKVILNIFPSLDTSVCGMSVRHFNSSIQGIPHVTVLCVSADLPFAAKRFCEASNFTNVIPASTFRFPEFGPNYGVTIVDGPLRGLLSRAIVVIDENRKVLYTEQVAEITQEPNYEAALAAAIQK